MKYTVDLKLHCSTQLRVEASSPEEAAQRGRELLRAILQVPSTPVTRVRFHLHRLLSWVRHGTPSGPVVLTAPVHELIASGEGVTEIRALLAVHRG